MIARAALMLAALVAGCTAWRPALTAHRNALRPARRTQLRPLRAQPDAADESLRREADDWTMGELAARRAPMEPSQDLGPGQVVINCFRGLQYVDIPTKNAGLERCHAFMTLGARVAATAVGRQQENRGVDLFIERGRLSPVFKPFFGASRIDIGELTEIPGTPTRGALASVALRVMKLRSGTKPKDDGEPKYKVLFELEATEGVVDADDVLSSQIFAVRLEKQRRPPPRDVWLITDIIDTSCIGSNRDLSS